MSLAFLCSGQGQQHAAMFDLTGAAPDAAPLFAQAARLLGDDPRAVAGDPVTRAANRAGQILCSLQALAAATSLGPWPARFIVAGYSVGELAAWSVAGFLPPSDILDLASQRAELMDASSHPDEGLLFVRGLEREVVDTLCARHEAAVAIVNPGDAYVLGGADRDLDALACEAERRGAGRVQRLPIRVASHTARLTDAAARFATLLTDRRPARRPSGVRLLSGIDGNLVSDPAAGLRKLAAQICSPVQWAACLEACVEAGATAFLELGPGHALADMASAAFPHCEARSLDAFRSLDGLRAWIERAGRD